MAICIKCYNFRAVTHTIEKVHTYVLQRLQVGLQILGQSGPMSTDL
jgi:hypothetical protein